MRKFVIATAFAIGALAGTTAPSSAMPAAQPGSGVESLFQTIAGGCGRGFHPNAWGRCVPSRYDDYRPGYGRDPYRPEPGYRPRPAPGYGGGYGPRPVPGYDPRPVPGYGKPAYRPRPGYPAPVDRAYCPPGRHPGNSGKCVKN